MLNDDLEIILITYNRKKQLLYTFEQLFAGNSPVRDIDITVFDNKSTDGSSELIDLFATEHPNLKHVRHHRNIGGVANSIRAFESARKKYIWVLCDDDRYDWSNWAEVEAAIAREEELICVARYCLSDENKDKLEHQMLQMTFIPAGIYKTTNITDTAIRNAYDSVHSMLPQVVFYAPLINAGKKICVISKPIVSRSQLEPIDETYVRGYNPAELTKVRVTSWMVGYATVCELIKDKELVHRAMRVAIDLPEIHDGFDHFADYVSYTYAMREYWPHVLTLFLQLDKKAQHDLMQRFLTLQTGFINDEKVLYDYLLSFGKDYADNFMFTTGQSGFNKKVYSMTLEDGTLRTISVLDSVKAAIK